MCALVVVGIIVAVAVRRKKQAKKTADGGGDLEMAKLPEGWESYIDDSHRPVVVEKTPDLLVSYLAAVSGPA